VSGFDGPRQAQGSLFPDEVRDKEAQLDRAADEIRERFGSAALYRGSGLLHGAEHKPAPRPK
jgi:acetylornithine/succinyldiaminopimelate/putrescine aminotransferase